MKKAGKLISVLLVLCMILGMCGFTARPARKLETSAEDQAAADHVAELIDAIYVQERTEDTDAQCAEAKAAWDALTDAQKELVEGEEADPDYFGRDTGDAALDDPRNADDIGENELLVVSFGTSFNDSRANDIKGIEDALAAAFPEWSVRRAFTAQIIINHVQARDGEKIDNVEQALERAVANGVKNLVVQPTHLMHGAEYDELVETLKKYEDKFESVKIAEPLLGEVGEGGEDINADKEAVAKAVVSAAVKKAGYAKLSEAAKKGVAFVFMGHGTSHTAKITYTQMQAQMKALGYKNVFIGTVEGEPEETSCENIIKAVSKAGYKTVILRPLMVVAGDHANNDMADPEDPESWYAQFKASGKFKSVKTQIAGLGRLSAIQKLYVAHTSAVIDKPLADHVAELIDAIYVQERTEDTDAQCAEAKAAWDALTDAQKELVEGEEADPDYFGRDTGDAALDDPRNADDIGENELLVVSFGTSFNDSRAKDIKGIEDALAAAFPDWSVRRAFTAQIIINHVQARDGEKIDNVKQALERAVANGVKNLVIQPTHLMHGAEYDELVEALAEYRDKFESVTVAEPLLGEVGEAGGDINADKAAVAKAVVSAAVKKAGYTKLSEAEKKGVAFVFMGHGTSHTAKITYTQMQAQMKALGYKNVFIGTVEGEPEETSCENIIKAVSKAGYKTVILRPLMVVAGDHANNDMADPEDPESWFSQFKASGKFKSVKTQISGLGRLSAIQKLYVAHAGAAIDQAAADRVAELIDAIYVQERTEDTDAQCAEAKAAWDALTVAQKELVEGEEADPDYFGRDTGDAALDDPLNDDDIGENELLVVSFGTSFNDSRAKDIKGIEDALAEAFPEWSVRRAFTAQIIINHVQARDGEQIDNVEQALERAVASGVKNLVVQPTHLMHGAEYDELVETLKKYEDKFESVKIAEPLLGEVGEGGEDINADKEAVAKAVVSAAVKKAGYAKLSEAAKKGVAFVFMGHGTSHTAKITYTQMQAQMKALGYKNVFIGTVEGEPEETSCENIIKAVSKAGYKTVILRPLMVVAGDHANNDMADPEDPESWFSQFTASGKFKAVKTQIAGLGRLSAIQKLYVAHTKAVIE